MSMQKGSKTDRNRLRPLKNQVNISVEIEVPQNTYNTPKKHLLSIHNTVLNYILCCEGQLNRQVLLDSTIEALHKYDVKEMVDYVLWFGSINLFKNWFKAVKLFILAFGLPVVYLFKRSFEDLRMAPSKSIEKYSPEIIQIIIVALSIIRTIDRNRQFECLLSQAPTKQAPVSVSQLQKLDLQFLDVLDFAKSSTKINLSFWNSNKAQLNENQIAFLRQLEEIIKNLNQYQKVLSQRSDQTLKRNLKGHVEKLFSDVKTDAAFRKWSCEVVFRKVIIKDLLLPKFEALMNIEQQKGLQRNHRSMFGPQIHKSGLEKRQEVFIDLEQTDNESTFEEGELLEPSEKKNTSAPFIEARLNRSHEVSPIKSNLKEMYSETDLNRTFLLEDHQLTVQEHDQTSTFVQNENLSEHSPVPEVSQSDVKAQDAQHAQACSLITSFINTDESIISSSKISQKKVQASLEPPTSKVAKEHSKENSKNSRSDHKALQVKTQQRVEGQKNLKPGDEVLDPIRLCCRRYFILNESLPPQTFDVEYKNYTLPLSSHHIDTLEKAICGFLNVNGGNIYLGINENISTYKRTVKGCKLTQRDREQIVKTFREISTRIFPNLIKQQLLKVCFVPVAEKPLDPNVRKTRSRKLKAQSRAAVQQEIESKFIKGLYVIRVGVSQGKKDQIYMRMGLDNKKKMLQKDWLYHYRTQNQVLSLDMTNRMEEILNIHRERILGTIDLKKLYPHEGKQCPVLLAGNMDCEEEGLKALTQKTARQETTVQKARKTMRTQKKI